MSISPKKNIKNKYLMSNFIKETEEEAKTED